VVLVEVTSSAFIVTGNINSQKNAIHVMGKWFAKTVKTLMVDVGFAKVILVAKHAEETAIAPVV
jgi:hypothetical protein